MSRVFQSPVEQNDPFATLQNQLGAFYSGVQAKWRTCGGARCLIYSNRDRTLRLCIAQYADGRWYGANYSRCDQGELLAVASSAWACADCLIAHYAAQSLWRD
jgi:hypothetical protein